MNRTAGCQVVELRDSEGTPFPVVAMYPAREPETPQKLGPYPVDVAMGAQPVTDPVSLVLISHGRGGSHLLYRETARHLARNGFAVCCPEHPFDNRNNNSLTGTTQILENRPRHLRIVTDWAYSQAPFAKSLRPESVAVIGHSMGGYTALAAVGGVPSPQPGQPPSASRDRVVITPDHRIKSLVLLAPATPWFMHSGALKDVTVPILMLTAEKDEHAPPFFAQIVVSGVRDSERVIHKVIDNAGHFSFMAPFPEAMCNPGFPPSQDPPGFDRAGYQTQMNAEILQFLRKTLA